MIQQQATLDKKSTAEYGMFKQSTVGPGALVLVVMHSLHSVIKLVCATD